MKIWDKGKETDKQIEDFTVGLDRELDMNIAKHDIIGSIAHVIMLESIGLVSKEEKYRIVYELKELLKEVGDGKFQIDEKVEDVHSQVEYTLTERLGEMGKKIHSGRSRNDQVLLDLKLYFREQIETIVGQINELFIVLQKRSEDHKDIIVPGYTHLQVAMPSSFGLWFGSYAESLVDDVVMLRATYKIVNQNPLGSAAGYGSSFPLSREMTTALLGFEDMCYNVVYAQMGRGKTEKSLAFSLASVASTINKLATDVCLYMSQNFDFLALPEEMTTGSSIMPHKKNPDVFELLRAKTNRLMALPNELTMMTNNLPSGYFRDYQLLKEVLFPAIEELKSCLDVCKYGMSKVAVRKDIIADSMYDCMFSVEEVNKLVQKGIPFRDAYKQVAHKIDIGEYAPTRKVLHTHAGSIGNLCTDLVRHKMEKIISDFQFMDVSRSIAVLVE
ncbi:MAG: argininosuccinate lyase [Bacteroidales bacterium]